MVPSSPASALDKRAVLSTMVSMLLMTLWAALAVAVVLTVIFPERSVFAGGAGGASGMGGTTASAR